MDSSTENTSTGYFKIIKFEQLFKDWKISGFHSKSDLPFILPTSHNSCLFLCFKMSCVQNSHMVAFMAAVLFTAVTFNKNYPGHIKSTREYVNTFV